MYHNLSAALTHLAGRGFQIKKKVAVLVMKQKPFAKEKLKKVSGSRARRFKTANPITRYRPYIKIPKGRMSKLLSC
jgi:hypothetical protein